MASIDDVGRLGVRHELQPADLLRHADDDLERALVAAAGVARARRASGLGPMHPSSGDGADGFECPFATDPEGLWNELQSVAYSGAPLLSVTAPDGTPAQRTFAGGSQIRADLASGFVIHAADAHRWSRSLTAVTEAVVAGWQVRLSASLVVAAVDVDDEPSEVDRLLIDVDDGIARVVRAGDLGPPLRPGGGPAVRAAVRLEQPGVAELHAQLVRSAGFDPLVRADLPRSGPSSYGPSLVDHPRALLDRVLPLVGEQLDRAASAWWSAALRFPPSPISWVGSGRDRSTDAFEVVVPGGPSFLDRRLPQPTDDRRVLAMAGHAVMLSVSQVEQLSSLLESGDSLHAGCDEVLVETLVQLDLLRERR